MANPNITGINIVTDEPVVVTALNIQTDGPVTTSFNSNTSLKSNTTIGS
jgi:hypothetical protein